jgi:putative ABC transport system ATP-binding protein
MAVVESHNLHRFFRIGDEEVAALRDVSFILEAGEMVALMGMSGSGKSTLLSCLAGLDEPDGGHVVVVGQRITHRSEQERAGLRAEHIGLLMQSGTLVDHLTIRENIALQQELGGRGKTAPIDQILDLLSIRPHADKLPRALSGGEVARSGLAVAIATNAPVLLCDEPTAEVDADTEAAVLCEIRRRCRAGTVALIATHSSAVARQADRVIEIRDGRIV